MLSLGDAIRVDEHVCVIASHPSQNQDKVFLVAFTSFEPYKDDSCLVQPGEHPRVSHLTCVAYDFFENPLFRLATLARHETCEPVSKALLVRILDGAKTTKRINMAAWCLLDDQGLV